MIINLIISVDEKRFDSDNRSEDYQAYENLVKETIDYESLEVTHHDDMRQVGDINGQNKKSFVKENHCFVYDN